MKRETFEGKRKMSTFQDDDGLFIRQIVALVKKDFIVIRAHRRAMISELVFPLLMGTLSCLFLSVFLSMSGYSGNGWTPWGCGGSYSVYSPPTMLNVETAINFDGSNTILQQCVPDDGVFQNESAMVQGFYSWAASNPYYYTPSGALFYQNFSAPSQPIDIYLANMFQQSQCVNYGYTMFVLFNNATPSVNTKILASSNTQQFNIRQTFATSGAIMLSFAFLPMTSTMAGRLVDEKKAKVREHLRVMGVSSLAYLVASFLTAMIRVCFVSFSMLILIGSFNIVTVASLFTIWLALVCYGFSLAGFAQMMPAFFARPTMSNAAVSVFIALTSVGSVFASQITELTPLLAFFLSPSAFVYAAAQALNNNFADLYITPGGAIGCLLWHIFLYGGLSQYLYNINPGEFGVARPLLFPIYDLIDFVKGLVAAKEDSSEAVRLLGKEKGSHNDRIVLENLVKVFGNETETPAVNKLSIQVREKEIFALLGHNGAGKTTTISMLIGMLPATSYDVAQVLGYDLRTHLSKIRRHIGICPQFDVLFDDLSAREHLDLYAAIKGKTLESADALLNKLRLPTNDQKASTFSGGMKRRLSVGNALVGDSPILFLDEPSSGLDPISRRQLWELLKEEKEVKNKTIVLTTHFMEEADYLGDRIAIMSHGRLYCCDTSAKLKETHGVGYYLNFAKKTAAHSREGMAIADVFQKGIICDILNRFTDQYKLHHESVGDATFLLPPEALPLFGEMLKAIEDNLDQMGCSSFGLSMNTLEDVFVNISEREAAAAAKSSGKANVPLADINTTSLPSGFPVEELFRQATMDSTLVGRFVSQTMTVYQKKWMSFSRSARLILTSIVLPIIMIGIGFGAAIPNFANRSGSSWTPTSWSSYYAGQQWPDELNPVVPIFQQSDNWSPAVNDVLDTFSQLYVEYEEAKGNSGASFNFQKIKSSEFSIGAFLGGHTISFLATFNPILQMQVRDDCVTQIFGGNQSNCTFVFYYNERNWAGSYTIIINQILQAAVETVWRRHYGVAEPVVLPMGIPILIEPPVQNTTTPAPATPVPTTRAPGHEDSSSSSGNDEGPEFILIPLAVLANICIGQFAAGICLPLADEMNRKIYQTLRLHGLTAAAYWVGTFLFDLTSAMMVVVAYIIGCYARGVTQIQNDLLVYQCLVLLFCIAVAILMSYVIVMVLPENLKPSTYIYAVSGAYYITLLIPMIIYVSLLSAGQSIPKWLDILTPSRALLYAIIVAPSPPSAVWTLTSSGQGWIAIGIWGALWLAILFYKTYFSGRLGASSAVIDTSNGNATATVAVPTHTQQGNVQYLMTDPDVAQEQARVIQAPQDNMAATIHLRKVFRGVATQGSEDRQQSTVSSIVSTTVDKVAVNDLTFGIRSGECFGLLGPNGAGKTTTVKMMMRETFPTAGGCIFPYAHEATDINTGCFGNIDTAYRYARLGVCQQGDTLWENFTAEEHMHLYLSIRLGSLYNRGALKDYISNTIKKVYLYDDAKDKQAGKFSGGMKRKLSVCIAMYTGARTIFLDEPSTGMDPYARRALWQSINEALENDRCVLLTTHSMEEADAVCARIAIVTNGIMKCIGNAQHLKNRFSRGFSFVITLRPHDGNGKPIVVNPTASLDEAANVQALIESPQSVSATTQAGLKLDEKMKEMFGQDCTCQEVLGLQRRYSVPTIPALSFAFKTLENGKESLGIQNYSVSQLSSLDQIFIHIAGSAVNEGN